MIECSSCGEVSDRSYSGMCQRCYDYYFRQKYKDWAPSRYGRIDRVTDRKSNQYDMCICHICGKAFTKLQQHIYYVHNMSREEYCKKFGLDKSTNMTTSVYNKKMRQYAYKYNMDDQLREVGKNTRFKKGHNINYERSYQTRQRLTEFGKQKILANGRWNNGEDN